MIEKIASQIMMSRTFTASRIVQMLCVFLIAVLFVDRSFMNPIRAEEAKPKAKAKSPPPAAPKAAEIRTETITYDTWTVSCRDTLDGKTRKICSAQLPMVAMQQNQQVQLGAWMIGRNSEGARCFRSCRHRKSMSAH